jgi:8-oxo-dGTP pyrophosphatase MutT (NUDIX family)
MRNLLWSSLLLLPLATRASAQAPAGMVLYFQSGGEVYLLLAEHQGSQRGWAGFGGGAREGETTAQTAAHKAEEETRGAFSRASLLRRIESSPVMDGDFACYFVEVDFVPVARVMNHPVPADNDAYLERGTFAWIPYSTIEPLVQEEIDRERKYLVDPAYLPAGSETQWYWPIWLGNLRQAIATDALPWKKP